MFWRKKYLKSTEISRQRSITSKLRSMKSIKPRESSTRIKEATEISRTSIGRVTTGITETTIKTNNLRNRRERRKKKRSLKKICSPRLGIRDLPSLILRRIKMMRKVKLWEVESIE